MPKASKKKKREKASDFQKVKLKLGKKKQPADNFTDTSFKAKSISLPTQNVADDKSQEQFTFNKKSLDDLLSKAKHYNGTVRKDAHIGILELVKTHPIVAVTNLEKLFSATSKSIIDSRQTSVFVPLHVAYTLAGLSHIQEDIREDALKSLNILMENAPNTLKPYASNILSIFYSLLISANNSKSAMEKATVKTQIMSQNVRHEILFSLCRYLRTLFSSPSFMPQKSVNETTVLELENTIFTNPNNEHCLVRNTMTNSILENFAESEPNLVSGKPGLGTIGSDTNSDNSAFGNFYSSSESNSSSSSSSRSKLCMGLLVRIFPFLEATWIETAPSLFNLTVSTIAPTNSKAKKKSQNNIIELKIISVVLEIVLTLWRTADDASFIAEVFEFVYGHNKTNQKFSQKSLRELKSYQQYTFLANIMVYFPLGSGFRDRISENPEVETLITQSNLAVTSLVAIANKSINTQFRNFAPMFNLLKDSNSNLQVIESMISETNKQAIRVMNFVSRTLGVNSIFAKNKSKQNHPAATHAISSLGLPQFNELLAAMNSFAHRSNDWNLRHAALSAIIEFNTISRPDSIYKLITVEFLFDLLKEWTAEKRRAALKENDISQNIGQSSSLEFYIIDESQNASSGANLRSSIDSDFQSWVLGLPKLLWSLKQANLHGSEILIDILCYCCRSPRDIFGENKDAFNKLQLSLIPLFHVTMPRTGSLYGPFIEYPLWLQKRLVELVYYTSSENSTKISGSMSACFKCLNNKNQNHILDQTQSKGLSHSLILLRNYVTEALPFEVQFE